MKKILELKAWPLFLVSIAGYAILPSPFEEITGLLSLGVLTLWEYSIGYLGEQRLRLIGLPRKNLLLYQINTVYIVAISLCLILIPGYLEGLKVDNFLRESVALIVPAGLYLLFAAFHVLVFNAKILTELEARQPASFGMFINNLLLLFFFPIGVWFLVPKVKKHLVEEYDEANLFESI